MWDERRLVQRAEERPPAALDMPLRGRPVAARPAVQPQPEPQPDIPGPWLLRARPEPKRGKGAAATAVIMNAAATVTVAAAAVGAHTSGRNHAETQRAVISPSRPIVAVSRALPPLPVALHRLVTQGAGNSSGGEAPSVPSPTTKPQLRRPPEVPRRSPLRTTAPAVVQARENVVARGLDAQRRRTQRTVEVGTSITRNKEDSPPASASPSTPTTIDGIVVPSLESRIDRLLGNVQHYPCHHEWVTSGGRSTCDSCYRGGSYISVSRGVVVR